MRTFIKKKISIPSEFKINFERISGIKFNNYFKKIQKNYLSKYKKDNDIEDDSIFKFTRKGINFKTIT